MNMHLSNVFYVCLARSWRLQSQIVNVCFGLTSVLWSNNADGCNVRMAVVRAMVAMRLLLPKSVDAAAKTTKHRPSVLLPLIEVRRGFLLCLEKDPASPDKRPQLHWVFQAPSACPREVLVPEGRGRV